MQDSARYVVTWRWRERDGRRREIAVDLPCLTSEEFDRARRQAMAQGYPGHEGGWWNWSVTDFHEWIVRRG